MGTDRKYDRDEMVPAICLRLATGKEPMTVICRDLDIPVRTVNQWRQEDKEIALQFDEARDMGYDAIAADCLEIADDGSRDYMTLADGREVPDHDHISRSKLRIETRMKLLAKWDPKRYGDKTAIDHTSSDGTMTPKGLGDFYASLQKPAEDASTDA
jgi:hypothetical protein